MQARGVPVLEPVRRFALQIHEVLASLPAPVSADDLGRLICRDFPEIAMSIDVDLDSMRAWLELLHNAGLASRQLDSDSGALVYRAETP